MRRWIILIALVVMAALDAVAQTTTSPTAPETRWLPAPPGVHFRAHAETPELLARTVEPDLSWIEQYLAAHGNGTLRTLAETLATYHLFGLRNEARRAISAHDQAH